MQEKLALTSKVDSLGSDVKKLQNELRTARGKLKTSENETKESKEQYLKLMEEKLKVDNQLEQLTKNRNTVLHAAKVGFDREKESIVFDSQERVAALEAKIEKERLTFKKKIEQQFLN